jgi:hypothetical protein
MAQMRNLLMLSAAASVLALGFSAHHVAALSADKPLSLEGVVQKVQKADEKGTAGGGKDTGTRAQDKSGDRGPTQGKDAQMRSGDKDARGGQQRSNVDVNVDRGRRGDRVNRRTTVGVDVDRRRRSGGRDVDVGVRSYGYGGVDCQDLLRRYRQCRAR